MRRTLFLILIAVLVAFGAFRWQRLHSLEQQTRAGAKKYTPAEGPRIDPKDVQVLTALNAEYTRLVAAVMPAVVSLTSERRQAVAPLPSLLQNPRLLEKPSLGSGVIVSKEGHILTNHHVIAGMKTIEVQLTDGRQFPAQLIGTDEVMDIAVLQISAPDITPLPLGDSDAVQVGEMVFAVGNPFGFQASVTQGIISGKERRVARDSGVQFLQTDAAVNEGNSGGPLLNLRGEIIGINSRIYSNAQETAWLGISFAIPSNVARHALESVLKTGRIVRGYLGVSSLTPEMAAQLHLPDPHGVLVLDVLAGSPGQKAGLRQGDVIRRFNGSEVIDVYVLRERLAEVSLGEKVELEIMRDGHAQTLVAEIVEVPAQP